MCIQNIKIFPALYSRIVNDRIKSYTFSDTGESPQDHSLVEFGDYHDNVKLLTMSIIKLQWKAGVTYVI